MNRLRYWLALPLHWWRVARWWLLDHPAYTQHGEWVGDGADRNEVLLVERWRRKRPIAPCLPGRPACPSN